MKKLFYIFIIILISANETGTYAQINCITDPPLPPSLTLVSVQPETGNIVINWALSSSSDIAAYIIYSYKNGDALALDTIWNPLSTSYTFSTTATKYFNVSFVVAAMRLPRCTSILSNNLGTIFSEVTIDTCNNKLLLKWNKYPDFPSKVTDYKILASINGAPFTEQTSIPPGTSEYSFSGFSTNSQYCFVVKATLEGGGVSTSNKACISTKMQRPPGWINADYATVTSEGKIALSFSIDAASEIKHFRLDRKALSASVYSQISLPVSNNNKVEYTDNGADLTNVYYYRLSAINNCNIPVVESNTASNIVLTSVTDNNEIVLTWNHYRMWLGSISDYRLFVNTGNGYTEKALTEPSDSVFRLNYKDIMYQVTGDKVCIRVEASENSNPYGFNGKSTSSEVCISLVEAVTVPNIFTPNHDLVNDYFRPVLSFTPKEYRLVISDLKRKILFESTDYLMEWDGSFKGNPQAEGAYLWFLKITTPSGKSISRTGTVTIFFNQK